MTIKNEVCQLHADRTNRLEDKMDSFIKNISSKVDVIQTAMVANSSNLTNFFKYAKLLRWLAGIAIAVALSYAGWSASRIIDNMNNITRLESNQIILIKQADGLYQKYIVGEK